MVRTARRYGLLSLAMAMGCNPDASIRPHDDGSTRQLQNSLVPPVVHPGARVAATLDDQFRAIDDQVRGFGGMFYDHSGRLNVYLKQGRSVPSTIAAIRAAFPGAEGFENGVTVLSAQFDYGELSRWRDSISSNAVDRTGLVFDDIDERSNRLVLGVVSEPVGERLENALVARGVPPGALSIETVAPPRLTQSLTDTTSRTMAGVQVFSEHAGSCTLGFNVKWNGVMHFVTASHCTSRFQTAPNDPYVYPDMGVVTGELFCQRSCSDSTLYPGFNAKIGTEVLDPPFQNTPGYWGSLCASNELCRMSDAAMIRYDYRVPTAFELAGVYWTTFDIVSHRPVTGEVIGNNHFVGALIQRLGITSGSSLGTVTRTCFHYQTYPRPGGKTLKLVCQNEMQGQGLPGDSGGPIYSGDFDPTTGTGVYLYGIAWGGRHDSQFNQDFVFYSPINNIQTDFGVYYSWQTY